MSKKFEINFLVICDNVIKDDVGKLSLISIYNVILTRTLPAVHPKFVLAGNIRIYDEKIEEFSLKIDLIDETGKAINSDIPSFKVASINKNQYYDYREHNIIYEIAGLKFDKAGRYAFRLIAEGEEIGKADFYLVKVNE